LENTAILKRLEQDFQPDQGLAIAHVFYNTIVTSNLAAHRSKSHNLTKYNKLPILTGTCKCYDMVYRPYSEALWFGTS
jgi:hypothetical protein